MKKNKLLFFTAYPVRYKPILFLFVMFLQMLVLGQAHAQGIKVSGVVKDPAGAGLQGVSVLVKGQPRVVRQPMLRAVIRSLCPMQNPYWFFLRSVL
jgi:hypothetical protein